MKNAMKRIMSLLLVTMLLVSAAPFALADGSITVTVKGDVTETTQNITITGSDTEAVGTLVSGVISDWSAYDITKAWSTMQQKDVGATGTITVGDTLTVILTEKAPAAPADPEPIHVVIKVNESDKVAFEFDKVPANGEYALVENLLSYGWNSAWTNAYTFDHAWNSTQQKNAGKTDKVMAGDLLYIMLKDETAPEVKPEEKPSAGTTAGNTFTFNYNKTNKYEYDVNLHIFLNGNTSAAHKVVTINSYATDDVISLAEVKTIVRARYNAKDSDGIKYDGLYLGTGPWLNNYADDVKYEYIKGVLNARGNQTVDLYVMINNAKVANSNADTTNPKTGDNIMIAATTMALAGAALVSVVELKKRKMI